MCIYIYICIHMYSQACVLGIRHVLDDETVKLYKCNSMANRMGCIAML